MSLILVNFLGICQESGARPDRSGWPCEAELGANGSWSWQPCSSRRFDSSEDAGAAPVTEAIAAGQSLLHQVRQVLHNSVNWHRLVVAMEHVAVHIAHVQCREGLLQFRVESGLVQSASPKTPFVAM
eukprot:CAMPEP_0206511148 /NCGR_PEP_ID=MMETSP0324_2-20121206/60119_1 /ASSEMBLY_ACC=CAM_ASM_000836 /TAXON_ID=2866 /ORGANISM="Crypthecodinium cohnii, Strain Seligo" /LENGTH=126 /DNA_ID=CAMNT_0054002875 /DNA_START=350 /DNA_END=730 /DNA_ORIENTATION=-